MLTKIREYIRKWERRGYPDGIPDAADSRLELMCKVPSYRMICRAILRNDVSLVSLGYSKIRCASYMELKRIEIAARGGK